jgi:hypothetical protein
MGRKRGTPKTGGRQTGTPNKVTSDIKTWINKIINDNREQLEMDLKQLEPKDRWSVIEKLMQYTTPKIQSITAQIDLDMLSDEQLSTIVDKLAESLNIEDQNLIKPVKTIH